RWMVAHGLVPGELTRPRLMEFLSARRTAGYTCWLSERGLRPLVPYLVELRAIPASEPRVGESPADRLLDAYGRYLVAERGVTMATVAGYRAAVRPFLQQHLRGDRSKLGDLDAAGVTSFVLHA